MPSCLRRSDGVVRHPAQPVAEGVPPDPIAIEDRTVQAGTPMRVRPSAPITGMTQVMQTPTPQAIASSTATWAAAPAALAASVTARNIAIGPQA